MTQKVYVLVTEFNEVEQGTDIAIYSTRAKANKALKAELEEHAMDEMGADVPSWDQPTIQVLEMEIQ